MLQTEEHLEQALSALSREQQAASLYSKEKEALVRARLPPAGSLGGGYVTLLEERDYLPR